MKRILMAIMAVAVAVTFSAPAFAGDTDKKSTESKVEKKGGHVLVYEDKDKKPAEPKPEPKPKDEKGK